MILKIKHNWKKIDYSKFRKLFDIYGAIRFQKILKENEIEDVYKNLFHLYNKYSKKKLRIFDKKTLNKGLIELRKKDNKSFGFIYDDAQISSSLYSLTHKKKFLMWLEKF